MGDVSERVWAKLPDGSRDALVDGLSASELQSVLLEVSRERAAKVTPARLLQRWQQDRFVRPSLADPRQLVKTQARLWERLPARFEGVELSPVTPLGTCSASRPSTRTRWSARSAVPRSPATRPTSSRSRPPYDVVPDRPRVDLAACQRVVRAQAVDGPGMFAHFQLFALVSSARDTGSGRIEAEMLIDHLRFWHDVLGDAAELTFTTFTPSAVRERIDDTVRPR